MAAPIRARGASIRGLASLALLAAVGVGFASGGFGEPRTARVRRQAGKKAYFGIRDLMVVKRRDEDVAAFHETERERWRKVYDEEYVETKQDFYPGDRVEVLDDDYEGRQGVVLHYDFDDGYESCQTCQSSYPVTVLLDEPE
ncbi:unnamed protein product [Effrenium voratum]|nr:unnamed protein product [Effrenium voratum]